jgi:hypothetical protein
MEVDDANRSRLLALLAMLRGIHKNLKYVGYGRAERDCDILADKLTSLYSASELKKFAFTAIPRGGFIVLGMLSYRLKLRADQLQTDFSGSIPLIVIDDCAMSGKRFADFINQTASPHIVFAHLYSPPALREAILSSESRVKHCIASHDLIDAAPALFSSQDEYEQWKTLRHERHGDNRYWVGQPEPVCFAWTEPSYSIWNSENKRLEIGWHFVPPHLCLKNRVDFRITTPPGALAIWQMPSGVAYGEYDDVLWLINTGTGQVYSLADISADMWRALLSHSSLETAVEYLAARYDVNRDILARDLVRFADDLIEKSLLESIDSATGEF